MGMTPVRRILYAALSAVIAPHKCVAVLAGKSTTVVSGIAFVEP
jgi:hypothetical protein